MPVRSFCKVPGGLRLAALLLPDVKKTPGLSSLLVTIFVSGRLVFQSDRFAPAP